MKSVFLNLSKYFPPEVSRSLNMISGKKDFNVNEIVFRADKPVLLIGSNISWFLGNYGRVSEMMTGDAIKVGFDELNRMFLRICDDSVYSQIENINNGFVTLPGGYRAGVCGRGVLNTGGKGGDCKNLIKSVRDIRGISIRIASEYKGCASSVTKIYESLGGGNLLISGPPCSGKTSFLRDYCRGVSNGDFGRRHKVSVIDERFELSGTYGGGNCDENGGYRFDLGINTDVYLGYPKSSGIMISLRTMAPEIIVFDELGDKSEVEALKQGVNSGIDFAFSIHSRDFNELSKKEQFKEILDVMNIDLIVFLDRDNPGKVKEIYYGENNRFDNDSSTFNSLGFTA